jgi:peptide/nickel transport system substrate-binding protein
MSWRATAILALTVAMLVSGCASPRAPAASPSSGDAPRQPAPKRLVIGVYGDLPSFRSQTNTISPGVVDTEALVNAGLAMADSSGTLHPQLAEAVPSVENGLWKLLPEGQMETTWKIRPNARWHDGTPFTAADVQFSILDVGMDRELPVFFHIAYDSIAGIDAPDPQTVVVRWKRVFVDADRILSTIGTTHPTPMPKHILARYTDDKTNFLQLPYWGSEFVGLGPFKVKEFNIGSSVMLEANDAYVGGRPKIDQIEVRFIQDVNAIMANILSGNIELTLGRGISLEQGLQLRQQWTSGKLQIEANSWLAVFPQFINPSPPVSGDVRFRRAMLHATDRQAMVDTIMHGESGVAHAFLNPSEPEYKQVEGLIIKYDYDPRRAVQLLEELGNVRGSDGMMRMANGQPLAIQFQTTAQETHQAALFSMGDYLKQVGVEIQPEILAPQRVQDREYRSQRPGFELARNPNGVSSFLPRNHGSQTGLPENNFRRYTNKSRYMNPEFDALIDRYFETVPLGERTAVLGQILHHMTENLNAFGLVYETEVIAVGNRVSGVTMARTDVSNSTWQSHLWDVK